MHGIRLLTFLFLSLSSCSIFAQTRIDLFIPLPYHREARPVEPRPNAEVKWNTRSFDFGFVPVGAEKTFRFQFRNTGGKSFRINGVTSNCGCLKIQKPETAVQPERSGIVEVVVSPKKAGDRQCYITLVTNTMEMIETLKVSVTAY